MALDAQPILKGDLVELRPLRADDYDDLHAIAADPRIWEQHPDERRHEEARFRSFFRQALASGGALIAIDARTRRAIGSSRFHGYDKEADEVEIGWTFLARSHWGGRYNRDMKRLMLGHAFRFVSSVVFLVGPENVRSQRAVERLGAVRVGSRPDGGGVDSYVYRLTASAGRTPAGEVNIDAPRVARLIAAQFPAWADLPLTRVDGGWDNRTFRLGDRMAVRLPSAERYAGQVEKEHRWLPHLAPHLPLPIPEPLALGVPANGYPWQWSVYRWLEGESATPDRIDDMSGFAHALAEFLVALRQIDPAGGPRPGPHNFFRGGPLTTYDTETRDAIGALDGAIDTDAAIAVWEAALQRRSRGSAVWLHGDMSAANLLVTRGRLSAVIDFGCSAVGDPACDATIAWTLFRGDSREAFRVALAIDDAAWTRAGGWALWKGLISLAEHIGTDASEAGKARQAIDEVLGDERIQSAAGTRNVAPRANADRST